MRLVQMAAGDQDHRMAPHQIDQKGARLRFHRPISGVPLLGRVEKQRAVEKPRNMAALRARHGGFEPGRLGRFFAEVAAEEHGVKSDQTETLDILDPAVGAEMGAPAGQPLVIDRLARKAPDGPLPEELERSIRDPVLLTAPQTLTALLLGVVFVMTTKPSLVGSLIVMAVALVLGLAWGLLIARGGARSVVDRGRSREPGQSAN